MHLKNFVIDISYPRTDIEFFSPKHDDCKADRNSFRNLLINVDWELGHFEGDDINTVWSKFKRRQTKIIAISIPMKIRKPWRLQSSPKIRTALRHTPR